MHEQWFKRYARPGHEVALELSYDVLANVLTIRRRRADGVFEEERRALPHLAAGLWAYDEVEGPVLQERTLTFVHPEGTDPEATSALGAALGDRHASEPLPKVKAALERGADPEGAAGRAGRFLCCAANDFPAEVVAALLEAGARPDVVQGSLTFADHPGATPLLLALFHRDEEKVALLRPRSHLPFHLEMAARGALDAFRGLKAMGADWKHQARMHDNLWGWAISELLAWGCEETDAVRAMKLHVAAGEAEMERALKFLSRVDAPSFPQRLEGALEKARQPHRERIIEGPLSSLEALRHPAWGQWVQRLIAAQGTYEAVAQEVYTVAVPRGRDSGWLSRSWGHGRHSNCGALLRLLARPESVARGDWAQVALALLERIPSLDVAPGDVQAFFASAPVAGHPQADALRAQWAQH